MSLIILTTREQMIHVATAVMTGIHDVFPKAIDKDNDLILLKKMKKGESQLYTQKTLIGFDFDREARTIWLKNKKRNKLLMILHGWLQLSWKGHSRILFDKFQSVISKIGHTFTSIPARNSLMSLCNALLHA
jgi:hypothetical protein